MNDPTLNGRRRSGWLKRLLCSVGALAALFNGVAAPAASSQLSEGLDYRPADAAPAAWREFAGRLQSHMQEQLAADDEETRRLQDDLVKQITAAGATAPVLTMRTWTLPDGRIDRIEFDGLEDRDVEARLRILLGRDGVGAPPPDMLQPLRMRLSLRPDEPPRREK